jgi:hypothetical protein
MVSSVSSLFAPHVPSIQAYVVTCATRAEVCARALASFRATDWGDDATVQMDDESAPDELARIHATWLKVLARVAAGPADVALIVEDDLEFNRHLRHNLTLWPPLRGLEGARPFYGSIYNPDRPARWRPPGASYFVADPYGAWGGQAVLVSRASATFFLRHWEEEEGAADVRMPRLAARAAPVFFHVPSLVQHVGDASTWGGPFHQARDFDPTWRAGGSEL